MSDKAAGAINETVGKAKQVVGQTIGNVDLEVEGDAQVAKGKAQSTVGKVKDAVKNVIDKA